MQINDSVVAIIFSKDRAMQLDAALRSLQTNCPDIAKYDLVVLYACSHQRYERQYEILKECYSGVQFLREQDFQSDLLSVLRDRSYVLFLVDDNLFVKPWKISRITRLLAEQTDALSFSLRLGTNTTYCYSLDGTQQLPDFDAISEDVLKFRWPESDKDFAYPADVSSSVYRVCDLLPVIEGAEGIKNPNLLEKFLDETISSYSDRLPYLLCFEQSAAFCNPVNVVQSQYYNRHGADVSLTPVELMRRFDLGYRIDLEYFQGFVPESCHQLVPISFLPPPRKIGSVSAGVTITSLNVGQEDSDNAETAVNKDETVQASCQIDLKLMGEQDRDSIHSLLRMIQEVSRDDIKQPWLYKLARAIEEDRRLETAESAQRAEQLERTRNDLQELRGWVAELERAKEWLEEQWRNSEENAKDKILSLEQDLNETRDQLTSALHELSSTLEELDSARHDLDSARHELDSARHELDSARHDLDSARHALDATHHELNSTRHELNSARHELHLIHNSRTYKLATLFRDAAYSKILCILLPLRLLLFVLPSRLTQIIKNMALPLFNKHIIRPPKPVVIRNRPWSKKRPLVSVVILCFNDGKYIEQIVKSVLSQTWHDLEIIVVYSGSDDDLTLNVLDKIKNPKMQILRQRKGTPVNARNAGITKAQGKYICCLNATDRLAATYLEKCLFRLENECLDICGSLQKDSGDNHFIHDSASFSLERLLRENCLISASVFKKDLWKSAGGFDETMMGGYEDWDLWIRMAKAGARASTIHEQLFSKGGHDRSMIEDTGEKREQAIEHIRKKHRRLLNDPRKVSRIDVQRNFVEVEGGLDNLVSVPRPPAEVIINVLLAMPFFVVGGADTIVSQICRYLSGRGIHFTIITSCMPCPESGDTTPLFEQITQEIYHLSRFLSESDRRAFVFYLIKSRKIDLLWQVGSSFIYDLMPEIKTHFPELKIVDLLFNEVGHTENNRKYNYCIDLILVENETVKDWLISHGETTDRVKCLRSGVDLSEYAPFKDRKVVRCQLGLDDGFVVGYCGRFSEEKCPEMFIEIANRLRKTRGIQFLMTGAGPMMHEVMSQIAALKLSSRIHFFGTVPDVKPYLGSCDVLLLPSKLDGRPTAVLQALAMGVPVIASNVGALPEIIKNSENGFLCGVGKIEQFVEALKLLASDSVLRARLSRGARRYAEIELDAEKWLSEVETIFRDLGSHSA